MTKAGLGYDKQDKTVLPLWLPVSLGSSLGWVGP